MNLVLLEPHNFFAPNRVRLQGRAVRHIQQIHRVVIGDELRVGVVNGQMGHGRIEQIDKDALEMTVRLDSEPPSPLPLRLILALPRPRVLNRTIAAAVSLGIREIDLINSWRVEKAYWDSPRLSEENLRQQAILGLEQARDTMLPSIRLHRFFTPFVREQLPAELAGKRALVAHPPAPREAPRAVKEPIVLVVGPEGGFIQREVETFREVGFEEISLGPRVLNVETAVACLAGRLF